MPSSPAPSTRNDPASLFETLTTPTPVSRRDTILAAASQVFITHGYEGASMELVAQAAGVARRTLYNQFPDGKQQLFHAVTERIWSAFPALGIATDEESLQRPERGLRRIGDALAAFWRPPLAIAFMRMLIGESRRFPDLMKSFFDVGRTPAVTAVRTYMQEMGDRGILRIDDPRLAARQFLGLIDESVLWVRVMGDEREISDEERERIVSQAVDMFLSYYRR